MEETQGKKSGQRFSVEGVVRYKTERAIRAYCRGKTGGGYKKALLDKIAKFVYRAMSDDEILEIVNAGKANREKVQKMKPLRVDIFQSDADHLGLPGLLEQCQTVRERVNLLAPRCVQVFWGEFFTRAIDHILSGDFCAKPPRKRRKKTAAAEPEKTKMESKNKPLQDLADEALHMNSAMIREVDAIYNAACEITFRVCHIKNRCTDRDTVRGLYCLSERLASLQTAVISARHYLECTATDISNRYKPGRPEQTELPLEVPRD